MGGTVSHRSDTAKCRCYPFVQILEATVKTTRMQIRGVLIGLLSLLSWSVAHGQLTPFQDAYTNSATPTTNFGTAVTLGTVSSASSIQTTYIQFDLSSVPSGYSGANVAKATLKLYVNAVTTAGSFNIDFVDGSWTEKTITASLSPALGTTIASSVPLTTANAHNYLLIDVTSAVQAWLNGTQANDGIALVANSPLSASFDSKENTAQSQPAELDLVLTGNGSGTITGVTTASGSGLVGGGTTGTLNLSLTNTCAAHQILRWSGTAWACGSAASGTVTSVASGTGLTGGPITSSGTLSIATGGVTNAMLANPSLTVTAGTGLTGGGVVPLGGTMTLSVDTTKIPSLAAANSFTAPLFVNESSSGIGLTVNQTGTSGSNYGIYGSTASPNGIAIVGNAVGSSGNTIGVYGQTSSTVGYGLLGYGPSGSFGVYSGANLGNVGDLRQDYTGVNPGAVTPGGIRFGAGNTGEGIASARTGTVNQNGIDFYTNFTPRLSVTNAGYIGIATTSPANQLDVHAQSVSVVAVNAIAASGASGSKLDGGGAISATGGNGDPLNANYGGSGIFAQGGGGSAYGAQAVIGFAGSGTSLDGVGGYFVGGLGSTGGDGVLGESGTGYAGNFRGSINVQGAIFAATKDFKIDHPMDPANKYLYHASVESSEMMNIYTGNVTTDAEGVASVELPDWFEVLNTDFRYQLTVIGVFAQAVVSREIQNHQFQIRTSLPNVKVSWQVTGVRHDAYAKAHPLVVEEEKEDRMRGFYIHPELYGAPAEKQIEWARHPDIMRRAKELAGQTHVSEQSALSRSKIGRSNPKEAQ